MAVTFAPGGRGSGRTTRQMQEAPQKAIFIWCSNATSYAEHLARKIGRNDLEIVGPEWAASDKWRGCELSGIVVDHATRFKEREREGYQHALSRVRT